jgi:hypothetical protein
MEAWIWVLIPVAAIVMWGARGIASTIASGRHPHVLTPPVDEAMRDEVEQLRQRVTELEERQDFTERVLTRGSARDGGEA